MSDPSHRSLSTGEGQCILTSRETPLGRLPMREGDPKAEISSVLVPSDSVPLELRDNLDRLDEVRPGVLGSYSPWARFLSPAMSFSGLDAEWVLPSFKCELPSLIRFRDTRSTKVICSTPSSSRYMFSRKSWRVMGAVSSMLPSSEVKEC